MAIRLQWPFSLMLVVMFASLLDLVINFHYKVHRWKGMAIFALVMSSLLLPSMKGYVSYTIGICHRHPIPIYFSTIPCFLLFFHYQINQAQCRMMITKWISLQLLIINEQYLNETIYWAMLFYIFVCCWVYWKCVKMKNRARENMSMT